MRIVKLLQVLINDKINCSNSTLKSKIKEFLLRNRMFSNFKNIFSFILK